MTTATMHMPLIKSVGRNGQISIGKRYAGKQVSLIECTDGTIILKPGRFIPDSEGWLYKGDGEQRIDKALKWVETSSRKDNYDEIVERIENV